MTTLLTLLAVLAFAVLLWHLTRAIVSDGLGHRPPPPSHYSDLEPGSPRWWVRAWHAGDPAWTRALRRLQPRH